MLTNLTTTTDHSEIPKKMFVLKHLFCFFYTFREKKDSLRKYLHVIGLMERHHQKPGNKRYLSSMHDFIQIIRSNRGKRGIFHTKMGLVS